MDLEKIESLLKLMRTYEVGDLAYEDADFKVRLRLEGSIPVVSAPSYAPQPSHAPQAPAPASSAAAPKEEGSVVRSPIVGTFYRALKPDSPPLVEVGQAVRKGQVLCIVEAMKLMNELESDVDGTVIEIMAANAQAVQYGQPLFRIRPG